MNHFRIDRMYTNSTKFSVLVIVILVILILVILRLFLMQNLIQCNKGNMHRISITNILHKYDKKIVKRDLMNNYIFNNSNAYTKISSITVTANFHLLLMNI